MKYLPSHGWKVLRGMGWSAQKPEGRARERDKAAIRHWREKTWPQLQKSPARRAEHRAN